MDNIESVITLLANITSLSLALNDPYLHAETLNCELEKINEWAKSWKVRFSEGKTKQLSFTHGLAQLQYSSKRYSTPQTPSSNFTHGLAQNQQLIFYSIVQKDITPHKQL